MSDDTQSHPISGLGKLPKYDGRGNVRQFLKTIEKRSKLEKWDDDYKATIVRYLCVDLAEAYLDACPESEELSYGELIKTLKERFDTKLSKPEAYSELMSITQRNDTIANYAGNIENAAANLSGVIDELRDVDERDALLISVFRNGLCPSIQKALIANEYDEFLDIVQAAKRCEKIFDKGNRNVHNINKFSDSNNGQSQYSHQDNSTNYNHNNNQYRPNYRTNQRHPSSIQCWNCGKRGHISRHCRSRRYNEPQNYDQYRPEYDQNYHYQYENSTKN